VASSLPSAGSLLADARLMTVTGSNNGAACAALPPPTNPTPGHLPLCQSIWTTLRRSLNDVNSVDAARPVCRVWPYGLRGSCEFNRRWNENQEL
jgi:hypothetical protein